MLLLPSLFGCSPDLAHLETEEAALSREVDVLRRNVEEMRTQMEDMGLRPPGPEAGSQDASGSGSDLTDQIGVTVERTGALPQFAPLGAPERKGDSPCGWRFSTLWLGSLADPKLVEMGAGNSSPILLLWNGVALEPHANIQATEKNCRFSFSHKPKALFFSPADLPDNVTGAWTMAVSPDFPLETGEGKAYWVYPGTTLTVAFDKGWNGDTWGAPKVTVDARNVYIGDIDHPNATSGSPSVISFLGKEVPSKELLVGVEDLVEPPDGAWTLEITSPSDGPYVFVKSVVVASDTHRRVAISRKGGK